jgi:hypothetical protein
MRGLLRPVNTRIGATLGLLALFPVALMLLKHQLTLVEAAQRAGVIFIGVLVFERVLLPVLTALMASGTHDTPEE